MPIYEFACDQCAHKFEELVWGNQTDINCPKCGSQYIHKLISSCLSKVPGGESLGDMPNLSGGCSGCSGGSCSTCH